MGFLFRNIDRKSKQRAFLSVYFFLTGFSFSSWTSRIPTIKENFELNDAQLSSLLIIMPISSFLGLPLSGWLVSRFDSRSPMLPASFFFALSLILIGMSQDIFFLGIALFLFSFNMRILNISMNTQAITLQKKFNKNINGSFHGLWSTGGIAGVCLSTVLVARDVPLQTHLLAAAVLSLVLSVLAYPFLLKHDRTVSGNKILFGKPDRFIGYLGLMVFFAAVCEGGMFDWSGIYFREVVHEEIFTLGYLLFMTFMALSRFVSDPIIENLGMPKTYILSALFISSGVGIAILWPVFWPSIIGFCMVGFGAASVIPMTFTLAGTSKKYSPGMAISIIATYGIGGMLLGPPLIGYISHAFNLKVAFLTFIIAGLMLIPISQMFFKLKE